MPPDPPTSPPSCKYAPPSLLSDPHINRVARRWMDSKAYSRIGRTKTQLKSVFIATGSLDPNVLLIRPNNRLSLIWFEWLRRECFITRWNTSIAKFVKNSPLCVASYFQHSQWGISVNNSTWIRCKMTGTSSAYSMYLVLKQKHFSSRKVRGSPPRPPGSSVPVFARVKSKYSKSLVLNFYTLHSRLLKYLTH